MEKDERKKMLKREKNAHERGAEIRRWIYGRNRREGSEMG
jgi:hypothetical protein